MASINSEHELKSSKEITTTRFTSKKVRKNALFNLNNAFFRLGRTPIVWPQQNRTASHGKAVQWNNKTGTMPGRGGGRWAFFRMDNRLPPGRQEWIERSESRRLAENPKIFRRSQLLRSPTSHDWPNGPTERRETNEIRLGEYTPAYSLHPKRADQCLTDRLGTVFGERRPKIQSS